MSRDRRRDLHSAPTAISAIRNAIKKAIPLEFEWWIEIDSDVGFAIRWIWTGHPGVSYVGRLLDQDASIAVHLLSSVNWSEQVDRSIQSVEAFEHAALKAAQDNRKLRLTGSALPLLSLPDPGPFSISGKRHDASVALASDLRERRRKRTLARLVQPTERELMNDALARKRRR